MQKLDLVLLTSASLPEPLAEDLLLCEELEKEGLRVSLENWEDFEVETSTAPNVLFRSTWGYSQKIQEFKSLLKSLSRSSLSVWNPLSVIRWNLHKKYLLELSKASLPVIPSRILSRNDLGSLAEIARREEWQAVVIKPLISASGIGCYRLAANADWHKIILEILQSSSDPEFLVQEFVPTIQSAGEISLIYIDGQFSHSVLKTAKEGEFRVQSEWGGQVQSGPTPSKAIETAHKFMNYLKEEVLYARVDLVKTSDGAYLLMELELIEPELFLTHEPKAARQIAASLSKQI
jgi:glutathione synthase/RimK-type ligase-like ATP-grasp enzyme